MSKGELLYEGKAKRVYRVEGNDAQVWLEFKDSLTALNGQKQGSFSEKGAVNRDIASLIFTYLEERGIRSHFVACEDKSAMRTLRLRMIALEVVVRNVLAGSTAKKFALKEGTALEQPLVEFYYKDDALGDPFISDEQALMLKIASSKELAELKRLALQINQALVELFEKARIRLIDFKVEFGRGPGAELLLADEISPDSCRLWDAVTQEKLDKDRFRQNLGQVDESYHEVLRRLQTVRGVKR